MALMTTALIRFGSCGQMAGHSTAASSAALTGCHNRPAGNGPSSQPPALNAAGERPKSAATRKKTMMVAAIMHGRNR